MRYSLGILFFMLVAVQIGKSQDTLFLYKKSGGVDYYLVSDIDSIDFSSTNSVIDTSNTLTLPFDSVGTVKDIDGNTYSTIKIGSQYWMASDLKTTRFSNGDPIATTCPPSLDISSESNPIYQWAFNGLECETKEYGRLYTWFVAGDSRNACPSGWHVPSDTEWNTLITLLGGSLTVGGTTGGSALKDSVKWTSTAGNLNPVGFSAIAGGFRRDVGSFEGRGDAVHYWTSTWDPTVNTNGNGYPGVYRSLVDGDPAVYRYAHIAAHGFHIRCIKD